MLFFASDSMAYSLGRVMGLIVGNLIFVGLVFATMKKGNEKPWAWIIATFFFGIFGFIGFLIFGRHNEVAKVGGSGRSCPKCFSRDTQGYGINYTCAECGHEWKRDIGKAVNSPRA